MTTRAKRRAKSSGIEALVGRDRDLMKQLVQEALRRLDKRVKLFDAQLLAMSREMPACRRLMAVSGIGVLTATALVAAVGDATAFRSGRQKAAWLRLVPSQRSTGGKPKLLGISKRGDRYLCVLLIHGARSSVRFASTMLTSNRPVDDWGKLLGDTAAVTALLDRLLHHAHILRCGPRSWRTKVQTTLRTQEPMK